MDYSKTSLVMAVLCTCFLTVIKHTDSKDTDTSACYSDVPQCGRHNMECSEGETVVITNARYAHVSRSTMCSRGKVSSCNSRYINTCCRPSGMECFIPYQDKDAEKLLRPCLGSRKCFHMTPQNNRRCDKYKLTKSTFSIVTHRCVLNDHIIAYNDEKQVTNNLVYLLYRTPTKPVTIGTANVYGCDVSGSENANVKVKAINIDMTPTDGGTCSGLEVNKDGAISSYSCDRSDLRFMSNIYDGSLPISINIVDVGGRPPEAAWVLVEGRENVTVECGKIRQTRKLEESTTEASNASITSVWASTTPTTTDSSTATKVTSTVMTTISTTTEQKDETGTDESPVQDYGPKGRLKPQHKPTESSTTAVVMTTTSSVTSPKGDNPLHTTMLEASVAVASSSAGDRVTNYAGIGGGILFLIVLIIIITVICYRRKRYRRYQSRKIEEERNIPDGEERSCEKMDDDKEKALNVNSEGAAEGEGQKGDTSNCKSPQQDPKDENSVSGNKRVKGRRDKSHLTSGGGTSPPRVSQPRDSDGYTNAGKPYGSEETTRNVTVEFYDNPGFKTTLENIKVTD